MPKAKYILHASKVDRIAIVDRPAVPNAEILLFKRQGANGEESKLEKAIKEYLKGDFSTDFMFEATQGAISALESGVWNAIFDEAVEASKKGSAIDKVFAEFKKAIGKLMSITEGKVEKQELPSAEEIVARFKQGVAAQTIQDAFAFFRNHMGFLSVVGKGLPETESAMTALADALKEYVQGAASEVIAKGLKPTLEAVLTKEGRTISSARLAKLKEALSVLNDIIKEAEEKTDENRRRRGEVSIMEGKQQTEEKAVSLESLAEAVTKINEVLGKLSERLKAIEDGSAKSSEKEKAFEEAVAEIKALKDTLEAVKNASDSAIKPLAEGLKPLTEKSQKLEADLAAEKSAREAAEARIAKLEKAIEQFNAGLNTLGKRMGMRTSVEGETKQEKDGVDVFGDALKGAGKK